MTANFTAGIITNASWHGLEVNEPLPNATTMLTRARDLDAWPTSVHMEDARTTTGLAMPVKGIVVGYQSGRRIVHGVGSDQYTPLDLAVWDRTIGTAFEAGLEGRGAFALKNGTKVLATFGTSTLEMGRRALKSYLCLIDDLSGSGAFQIIDSHVDVVCSNTLAMAVAEDGKRSLRAVHRSSINQRAEQMREAIRLCGETGESLRDAYLKARDLTITSSAQAQALLDAFVPMPTDATRRQTNTVKAKRADLIVAAKTDVNKDGSNVATMWNAATFLVDRDARGNPRKVRGESQDRLTPLFFGSRGDEVRRVKRIVDTLIASGIERGCAQLAEAAAA